jgi:hypothetical protein
VTIYRDFIGMTRDARQHVLTKDHILGRFDVEYLGTVGYHCFRCGAVWQITPFDIHASNLRQQNIMACSEIPNGFDILLDILNATKEDEYLYHDVLLQLPPPPPSKSRYDRKDPI